MQIKPNFLCIGAQKAGTSWLWVVLKQHPEIWMPPFKELHYFDHKFIESNRKWTLGHLHKGVKDGLKWHVRSDKIDLRYFRYLISIALDDPFTEEWYFRCFDRPMAKNRTIGDITPEYSTLPREGLKYVKELLGEELKLIYIIRKPIDRALSQVKMNLSRRGFENIDLKHWLSEAKNEEILQRGDYKTYIKNWEDEFGTENILYLPFKLIKKKPKELLKSVEDHLKISNFSGYSGLSEKVHAGNQIRVPRKVREYIRQATSEQMNFLEEKFGSKFCKEI